MAFEEFVQTELPLRPAVIDDPALETILVRRGQGARIMVPVALQEGEVLGLSGGVIKGVPNSGGATPTTYAGTILPDELQLIATLSNTKKSGAFIIDLETVDGLSESFQMFYKVKPADVDYTEYSNLGDTVPKEATAILNGSNTELFIKNNYTENINYDVRVV